MTGALVAAWDTQQAAYIAGREQRFTVMLDVLGHALGETFTAIDLACGPGSLTERVLRRHPGARVVGVDHDPALLHLAGRHLAPWDDRVQLVDADLTQPDWVDAVTSHVDGPVHAIVSTTALHWLSPSELLDVYTRSHSLLARGGVLLNGDHLRFDARTPQIRSWSAAHDTATQDAAFATGAQSWDAWWTEVAATPELAALTLERDRRFADRQGSAPTTVDLHLAALRQAGFRETGTVWQLFDDYVVYGTA